LISIAVAAPATVMLLSSSQLSTPLTAQRR